MLFNDLLVTSVTADSTLESLGKETMSPPIKQTTSSLAKQTSPYIKDMTSQSIIDATSSPIKEMTSPPVKDTSPPTTNCNSTQDKDASSLQDTNTNSSNLKADNSELLSQIKLPQKLPSIIEIKKKLPKHCFELNASTSLYFVIRDFLQVIAAYYVGEFLWNNLSSPVLLAITPVFLIVQGVFFLSLFVIGHDCSHGAFSHSNLLNDVVGTISHTFVLTPYYTWKISHKIHHKNNANIDKDEAYFPVREKYYKGGKSLPAFGFGISWFGYLVKGYTPREVPHFNPFHPLYKKHLTACILTVAVYAVWVLILIRYAAVAGFAKFCFHYFGPCFVFASYTVMITFLHHHDDVDDIPWYSDRLWDNVRGQLSTVDRDYGIIHHIIHSIGTHQVHHLFPKMAHYHLEEATTVFRKEYPELVHVNNRPILSTYFNMFSLWEKQVVIPDDRDIHIYKSS